jgi:DNA-binding transcriptional LysR family regulator
MKLSQFRDVVAIAERGSLRAAARHLRVAQPALTRSIRELERELGSLLFERQARGMLLTPVGKAFVERAKAVLSEVRRARDEAEQLHGGTRGSVVAGFSTAAHLVLLPAALRSFRVRYPDVRLHVIEGVYPTLEAGLRDGSIDLYVGPRPKRALPADLIEERLFDNLRMILGRKDHPLSGARSLKDLSDAEWATTSITLRAEEELGELFETYGLPAPRLALQAQSALSLMISLAHSDLLAMVSVQ